MATTATTIIALVSRFPYIGVGLDVPNSPIPQAEVIFSGVTNSVTAAGAGEDQSFSLTMTLKKGYGYVLVDANLFMCDIEAGDTGDWDAALQCFLQNAGSGGGATGRWRIGQQLTAGPVYNTTSVISCKNFTIVNPSNKIIVPINGLDGSMIVTGFNTTVDGGAMNLDYVFKFLEFSLSQVHHWMVNTPFPVR